MRQHRNTESGIALYIIEWKKEFKCSIRPEASSALIAKLLWQNEYTVCCEDEYSKNMFS